MANNATIRKVNSKYELTRTNGDKLLLTAKDAKTVYDAVLFEMNREDFANMMCEDPDYFKNVDDDICNNDDFITDVLETYRKDPDFGLVIQDEEDIIKKAMLECIDRFNEDDLLKK